MSTRLREELVGLLREGRFSRTQAQSILLSARVSSPGVDADLSSLPTSLNLLHHSVIREFLDAESCETKTMDSNNNNKKKKKAWSDTELHEYWMEILRGVYTLTARRYVCALRIAKLIVPEDKDDNLDKVRARVKLVQSLVLVPSPNSVFHSRTPLHHSTADGFRRDAMQRLGLTSIRRDPDFEDKYNEQYFTRAVALSRALEKEIAWLRRSVDNPSLEVMF